MSAPTFSNSNVGSNVKRLRVALGWAQEDLSSKMGTSKVWVSQVERGESHVNVERLVEFAGLLDSTPNALLAFCRHCEGTKVLMARPAGVPVGAWVRGACYCQVDA
jgi:transcriptional regulator with XRE-family HTH domain